MELKDTLQSHEELLRFHDENPLHGVERNLTPHTATSTPLGIHYMELKVPKYQHVPLVPLHGIHYMELKGYHKLFPLIVLSLIH
jgi:hypothetical protein